MSTNGTSQPDEIGWLFVQQYYTNLSKTPNRLHLFYSKKSQFVSGTEAEVIPVSVGRQNIQERIAQLGFEDCKVRVSNVDTQSSLDQIVIQVIGELSNKSEDSRKFVQTFILAQQPSGYFVLNDIFRYIKDEDDEPVEEETAAAVASSEDKPAPEETKAEEEEAVATEAATTEAAKPELDATVVDQKLEEVAKEAPAIPAVPAVPTVAVPTVAVPEAATPKAAESVAATPAAAPEPEKVVAEVAKEAETKVEEPKEPVPTPAAAPAAAPAPAPAAPAAVPAPAEPEKPKAPAKPMTWASRIAASAPVAKPVVPKVPVAAPSAAAAPAAAAPAAAAPVAVAKTESPAAVSKEGSEWQTAGIDSKRQNRPQSVSTPPQDKDSALGYIKYVTEKVDEATLHAQLEKYGQVVYFDINRTKNCAFIEFASSAGYQAAVAANPHVVNGENIYVEARRPKAGAYGSANYSTPRGNAATRGRGGFEGRNGGQNGGRGGFSGQNRGRGGAGGLRGRGGAQNLAA